MRKLFAQGAIGFCSERHSISTKSCIIAVKVIILF